MAISTDIPIVTTTLTEAASTVTLDLSSLQQYTNLKIVINCGISSTGQGVAMSFSGSSTGYSNVFMTGSGSSATSGNNANQTNLHLVDVTGNGDTSIKTAVVARIMNYASTNMGKAVLYTSQNDGIVQSGAGYWNSNSAITSIVVGTTGGNFVVGSTFSVYATGTGTSIAKATGGTIYKDADYVYHVFNATGSFTPTESLTTDVFMVAGGGGGGARVGGGAGAGGYRLLSGVAASATAYTITVGAGGTGEVYNGAASTKGSNSSALTYSSTGGGRGGSYGSPYTGYTGGSGGGGNGNGVGTNAGGTGNEGGYSPVEGYSGGQGVAVAYHSGGGGGGGAGAAGTNAASGVGGTGGVGVAVSAAWLAATGIGYNGYIAAGGGGGAESGDTWGVGGAGGGGTGSNSSAAATAGRVFTGSGGGGGGCCSSNQNGGNGGSGIVIVRYAR